MISIYYQQGQDMVELIRRREQQIYVYIYKVPNQSIDRSIACLLLVVFFCCYPEYVPKCTFPGPRPQATAAAASFLLTKKRSLVKECPVCVYFEKLLTRLLTWSVILKETRAVQLCLRVSYRNMQGRKFFPLLHSGCVAGSISSCSCCLVPATCT